MSAGSRSLLVLVGDPADASVRFRVSQFLPRLRESGFRVDLQSVAGPLGARLRRLRAAGGYDRVLVHRVLLAAPEAVLLAASTRRGYVFDFDDALMVRDSAHASRSSWQRVGRLRRMVRSARTIAAGNEALATWARAHHERVVCLPTAIDLACHPPSGPAAEPVLGWIGTRPNLPYLRTVLPWLAPLAHRRPGLRLKVVSDGEIASQDLPLECRRWTLDDEAAELASFQIGLMPLPDDPWTRGKCGGKLLQYLATALPAVCSPVGANREIVRHGVDGLHATTASEWAAAVAALLDDEPLRRRLGDAGRRTVAERYSLGAVFPELLALLD